MKTTIKLFAVAGTLAASVSVQAQEVTFKIAHFLPSAAPTQQRVLQPWCDELKKDSGGRIACQFFPAMQLGGTPAQLADQVKNGVADVVWTGPGYSAGRFPAIEAFELPFMVTDSTSSSKALWKFYQQHAQQEFAAYKVLAFHTDGGQAVHTSKKAVTGLTGFTGMKLRTSTRVGARTLAALGGSPVAMPPAQVTEAIAKGVVDGSLGAWELVFPTKLSEVTKFHAQPAMGVAYPTATVLTVLMNKQKYDALPADLKAVVDKHSGEALVARFGAVFDDEAAKARKKVAEIGNQVTTFSAVEVAAMKRATAGVEEEWAKQVGDKGLDGKKLISAARELTGTNK
ncbi:TRAP transporter substrate-binding protein [Zoogloea dura]|jgi:TRAP-type C4-dicarboxylate transport system substrate-binding protein|uniref:TRAP transporter substrate-binding protein n=1 Tax=Zoogloea dura TaxID=2728840 RepID=A0A848GAG1_9RHOO|nr:TRAP transporter substrate-binding protein [Zoogloea dura]NML27383.1 TRAP transporter substrate-binding protein [Zoogloea dura]